MWQKPTESCLGYWWVGFLKGSWSSVTSVTLMAGLRSYNVAPCYQNILFVLCSLWTKEFLLSAVWSKIADLCIQLQNMLTAHQILWLALPVADPLKRTSASSSRTLKNILIIYSGFPLLFVSLTWLLWKAHSPKVYNYKRKAFLKTLPLVILLFSSGSQTSIVCVLCCHRGT